MTNNPAETSFVHDELMAIETQQTGFGKNFHELFDVIQNVFVNISREIPQNLDAQEQERVFVNLEIGRLVKHEVLKNISHEFTGLTDENAKTVKTLITTLDSLSDKLSNDEVIRKKQLNLIEKTKPLLETAILIAEGREAALNSDAPKDVIDLIESLTSYVMHPDAFPGLSERVKSYASIYDFTNSGFSEQSPHLTYIRKLAKKADLWPKSSDLGKFVFPL